MSAVTLADLPPELLAHIWSFLPLRELVRASRISRVFDIPVFFWARARPDRVLAELADAQMPDEVCCRLAAACAGLPCADPVEAAAAVTAFADEAVRAAAGLASGAVPEYLINAATARLTQEYARVFRRPAVVGLAAADPSFRLWWPSSAEGAMISHECPALFRLVLARGHFVPSRRLFDKYIPAGDAVFRMLAEHFPAEFADWLRAQTAGPELYKPWTVSGLCWLFAQFRAALGCPLPPGFSTWIQYCGETMLRRGRLDGLDALDAAVAFAQEFGVFDALAALSFDWAEVVARTAAGPRRVYIAEFSPNNYSTARRAQMLAELCLREPRPGIIAEFSREFAADAARWTAIALMYCKPAQRAALCRALDVSARVGEADLGWLLLHKDDSDRAGISAQTAQTAQTAQNVCKYLSEFDGDAAATLRAWLATDTCSWAEPAALAAALAYCGLAGAPVRVTAHLALQPRLALACAWRARLLENCNELIAAGLAAGSPVHWRMLTPLRLGLAGLTPPILAKIFRTSNAWRFRQLVENTTEPLGARVLAYLARVVNDLDYTVFLALLALIDKRCLEPAANTTESAAEMAAAAAGLEDAIVAAVAHGAGLRARALLAAWPSGLRPARACRLFVRAVGRSNSAALRALCACNGAGFVPGPALGTYARAIARCPATLKALDELCIGQPWPP